MRLKAAMPEKLLASLPNWLAFPTKVGNHGFPLVLPFLELRRDKLAVFGQDLAAGGGWFLSLSTKNPAFHRESGV